MRSGAAGTPRPGEHQAIARDAGPKGVHVAYVVIDAVIDVPWARERFTDRPEAFFIKSTAIADEIFHFAHPTKAAWSFNSPTGPDTAP